METTPVVVTLTSSATGGVAIGTKAEVVVVGLRDTGEEGTAMAVVEACFLTVVGAADGVYEETI